jgi:HK97 family phage prohead protease
MGEELQLGAALGELELRAAGKGKRLSGRFPYGSTAVLSDGGRTGRPRKERFKPRAFEYRVRQPDAEIHLLVGHDYAQPLARKLDDSLRLRDTEDALFFEAEIAPELEDAPYFANFWATLRAGLIGGISPGFRLPPERAVPRAEAETFEDEEVKPAEGMFGAIIRSIGAALLFELSLVVLPAYKETEVEARGSANLPDLPGLIRQPLSHLRRWRP